jgi:hypothetical protein
MGKLNLKFRLDARDTNWAFPCSICKYMNEPENECRKNCEAANYLDYQVNRLKSEVEALIQNHQPKPKRERKKT